MPPALRVHIRAGPTLDIADANNRPLRTVGYLPLVLRLGTYVVQLDFVVCDSLAAPVILGCDFCDRFVEAIRPRAKTVEMADGSTVPIVRKPLKRATKKRVPLPAAQEPTNTSPVSTKFRVANSLAVPPESQVWVSRVSKHHGIRVVQPSESLYNQRQLAVANGVVSIVPDVPFKVLVANFGKTTQWLVKHQTLGSVLPHPMALVPTRIPISDVLGVQDPKEGEEQPANSEDTARATDADTSGLERTEVSETKKPVTGTEQTNPDE